MTGYAASTATFTITVSNPYGSPLSYYWYKNGSPVSSTLNTSATTSNYTTPVLIAADSGSTYYCIVKYPCTNGVILQSASNSVILNVLPACIPVSILVPLIDIGGMQGNPLPNSTITVAGTPPFTYSWYYNGALVNTQTSSSTSATYNFLMGGLMSSYNNGAQISCTVTNCNSGGGGTGNSVTSIAHITVGCYSTYIANSPAATTVCSGSTFSFCPTYQFWGGSYYVTYSFHAYLYSGNVTGFSTAGGGCISDVLINTGTTNGVVQYDIRGENSDSGCGGFDYIYYITVKPKPLVTVNSPTICIGQSANLTAGGATTYSWSSGVISTGSNIAIATPAANTTYTVTGTLNGCTNTTVSTVNVNTLFPIISVNSPSICSGTIDTLLANGATSYVWSGGATQLGIDSALINPVVTTTYSVVGTTNSCMDTAYSTVVVNPTYSFNDSQSICNGSHFSWHGNNYSTPGDYTINYASIHGCDSTYILHLITFNDSTTLNTNACGSYYLNAQTYTSSGRYYQTLTNINGCDSTVVLNLTVNPAAPALPSTILGVTHVCEGSSTAYAVTNDINATSYTWTLPLTWTGSSDSSYITATADTTAGVIYVTANNSCGSSPPQSVNVYGSVIPVVTFAPLANVCDNAASFALYGGNPPGGTYSGQGVNSNIFTPATVGNGTYYITYTYVNGACTVKDSVPITVDICLGINQTTSEDGISIFPNPFTSETTITFSEEQKNTIIIITDILGKEIRTVNFTGKKCIIEKGEMQAGIYFLQIMNEKKNVVNKKVVVQ